jgi:hypothetical protein
MVDLTWYYAAVKGFDRYPAELGAQVFEWGLFAEVGEFINVHLKHLRGQIDGDEYRDRLIDELGDVLWYAFMLDSAPFPLPFQALTHKLEWDIESSIWCMRTALLSEKPHIGAMKKAIFVIADYLGVTIEEVARRNVVKLTTRYASG